MSTHGHLARRNWQGDYPANGFPRPPWFDRLQSRRICLPTSILLNELSRFDPQSRGGAVSSNPTASHVIREATEVAVSDDQERPIGNSTPKSPWGWPHGQSVARSAPIGPLQASCGGHGPFRRIRVLESTPASSAEGAKAASRQQVCLERPLSSCSNSECKKVHSDRNRPPSGHSGA